MKAKFDEMHGEWMGEKESLAKRISLLEECKQ